MGDRAVFVQQLTGSCKPRQKHNMLLNKQLCEPRAAPWKACQEPQAAGANVPPAWGCTCSAKHRPAAGLRLGVTVLTAGRAALLSLPAAGIAGAGGSTGRCVLMFSDLAENNLPKGRRCRQTTEEEDCKSAPFTAKGTAPPSELWGGSGVLSGEWCVAAQCQEVSPAHRNEPHQILM